MSEGWSTELFDLTGMVAVVTGGSGALGSAMALGLAQAGAKVAVLARRKERVAAAVEAMERAGAEALGLPADVLVVDELRAARDTVLEKWGRLDILVNAAGGNLPEATLGEGQSLFDLSGEAMRQVIDLNLMGTLLPCQIFGSAMAEGPDGPHGSIVNISSMASARALTRIGAYGAAKAGVDAITRWLATEMARRCGPGIRVNAIAPGFFVGEQNRDLLLQPNGEPTERGQRIVERTPMGRFGEAEDLVSTLVWLCGPGSRFVTGVVVPVDGGFSAFGGV
jgi:NAD(P)-dependent dehydrogenase (short-subunit alcohol dehydrogenase family)